MHQKPLSEGGISSGTTETCLLSDQELGFLSTDMTNEFEEFEMTMLDTSSSAAYFSVISDGDGVLDVQAVAKVKKKGGRKSAMDARLDPRIDPKKAARIMANRCEPQISQYCHEIRTWHRCDADMI